MEPAEKNDPSTSGSRFFTCLMVAAVFIIIDLVILLYFFWPFNTE